jgi:anti-anti-sigma regulatory factor
MAEGRSSTVALPAVVDLDALDSVRDRLLDAVESGAVAIDCADVERLSTNALIMLLSAAETARRNEYSFALERASPQMLGAIDRLGLRSSFDAILRG